MNKLQQLEKLLSEATEGPWNYVENINGGTMYGKNYAHVAHQLENKADGILTMHLRNAAPALIEIVKAAKTGPCRHYADHRGDYCDLCKALKAFDEVKL